MRAGKDSVCPGELRNGHPTRVVSTLNCLLPDASDPAVCFWGGVAMCDFAHRRQNGRIGAGVSREHHRVLLRLDCQLTLLAVLRLQILSQAGPQDGSLHSQKWVSCGGLEACIWATCSSRRVWATLTLKGNSRLKWKLLVSRESQLCQVMVCWGTQVRGCLAKEDTGKTVFLKQAQVKGCFATANM